MDKTNEDFETVCKFVIKLGTLAHRYGTQARRLESYLTRVTRSFGYSGFFRSTPTNISFTFTQPDELWHKIHHIYMPGTGFDLFKLSKVGELVADLESGKITLTEANDNLDEIDNITLSPPYPYGKILIAIGYILSGAGFAGFLNCGLVNIILSAILSLIVYLIILYSNKFSERFEYWTPFLCTFIASVIASLISIILPETKVYLVTLSAVIYLIPGFTISCGIIELSYKYVQSGIINIVNGLVYLSLLFAGAWTGATIIKSLFSVNNTQYTTISLNFIWLFAMIMAVGLCIVFQTPKRDFLWAILGSGIACLGIVLGEAISGVNAGNFFGAVLAVVFSNIWSAKTNRAASLVLLPSIVFLVSGSIGFRGFVALSSNNTTIGEQEFIHMFVVAVSISVGLLVGNTIYKPKITL